jgi:hypothetical protein
MNSLSRDNLTFRLYLDDLSCPWPGAIVLDIHCTLSGECFRQCGIADESVVREAENEQAEGVRGTYPRYAVCVQNNQ